VTLALTSFSPARAGAAEITACVRSWRAAGLDVVAFNRPDEITLLRPHYDADFVPVDTDAHVPVSAILQWARERDETVLLLNSDVELALAPWELERLCRHTAGGLLYLVRHNHDGDFARAVREPFGIDAFLFRGRDAAGLPDSSLALGLPFWDYWLPCAFLARGLPLYSVDFPAAFHASHAHGWSWDAWQRCAAEFVRVTGEHASSETHADCHALSGRVRRRIDDGTTMLSREPTPIREWVESTFRGGGPKLFLELGSHGGTDTAWLAAIPGVTLHAFEPDPRNTQQPRANVTLHRAAVADRDGRGKLILSLEGWGREWTYSSSLRSPKNHLQRYPVTFGDSVEVDLVALDTFCDERRIERVDFLWADVQGAERDVVRGGLRTLRNTRYVYMEYSDEELYEGQATLAELLALLPDFRVLELWPEDVLLENRRLAA
jgi:FkbM family methyltransferase